MLLNYDIYYGTFIQRPNRFIAIININNQEIVAHVPNTGRLKELLIPGAEVMLSHHPHQQRKTQYELRMIKKEGHWISIDSQLPNSLAAEAINAGVIEELSEYPVLKREVPYGSSRFDIKLLGKDICFVEVKGVTLERDGWSYFPDAPTERGRKHIDELIDAVKNGYRGVLLFVIQLNDVQGFSPNTSMDEAFSERIRTAAAHGVEILAYGCDVTPQEVKIVRKIPVEIR